MKTVDTLNMHFFVVLFYSKPAETSCLLILRFTFFQCTILSLNKRSNVLNLPQVLYKDGHFNLSQLFVLSKPGWLNGLFFFGLIVWENAFVELNDSLHSLMIILVSDQNTIPWFPPKGLPWRVASNQYNGSIILVLYDEKIK